jgi:hypothetical protein
MSFELLLSLFIFLFRTLFRSIKPFDGIVDNTFQLDEGVTEVVSVRLESILGSDASSCGFVLS